MKKIIYSQKLVPFLPRVYNHKGNIRLPIRQNINLLLINLLLVTVKFLRLSFPLP